MTSWSGRPSESATRIGRWVVRFVGLLTAYVAYQEGARWWTVLLFFASTAFVLGVFWHIVVVTPLQDEEGK